MKSPFWEKWPGVAVPPQHRTETARDIIRYLEENPKEKFQYILGGEALVMGVRLHPDDGGGIELFDLKVRRTKFIPRKKR